MEYKVTDYGSLLFDIKIAILGIGIDAIGWAMSTLAPNWTPFWWFFLVIGTLMTVYAGYSIIQDKLSSRNRNVVEKTRIAAFKEFIARKSDQMDHLIVKRGGSHTHDVTKTKDWYDKVYKAIKTAVIGDSWLKQFELRSTIDNKTGTRLQKITYPMPIPGVKCSACNGIVDAGYMLSRLRDGITEPDLNSAFTIAHLEEFE